MRFVHFIISICFSKMRVRQHLWWNMANAGDLLSIFNLRKQMMLARIDAKNSVRGVLAKKQLDELKQWHCGRRLDAC